MPPWVAKGKKGLLFLASKLFRGDVLYDMIGNITVRLREIGTGPIGTILELASVPPRKIGTRLLGFCRPVSVSYLYIH